MIENLDSAIVAIAHVHVVMRAGGKGVREPELTFGSAGAPPFVEETSVSIEVRDSRVFVSVRNQDGSVGQVGDVGWHIEVGWTGAGTAGFTEHQERFTLWTQLDYLMQNDIRYPYIVLAVESDAVGHDELVGCESAQKFAARGVDDQDGWVSNRLRG